MKCPRCSHNQPYKDGRTCAQCRYQFVLDPKVDGMADGRFAAAVEHASAHGTLCYTSSQLYSVLCRATAGKRAGWLILLAFLCIAACFVLQTGWPLVVVPIAVLINWLFLRAGFVARSDLDRKKFNTLWQRYRAAMSPEDLSRWIDKPALHDAPAEWSDPDIHRYGAEGVLIVDSDHLVDWLVRNDFHVIAKVLVLAASGYPKYVAERAAALLEKRPELPVFVLHKSSSDGQKLAAKLVASGFIGLTSASNVTDLGLSQDSVKALRPLRALPVRREAVTPDMIGFSALSTLLVACIAQQVAIGAAVAASGDGGVELDFG